MGLLIPQRPATVLERVTTRRVRPANWLDRATLLLAIGFVLLIIAWSLVPGVFSGLDPISGIPADKLSEPDWAHPLGTDHLGRDVFSRVVHGSATSVGSALVAVAIGLVFGSAIGLVAASIGGVVDALLMRVIDVLLAIPSLLLSMIVVVSLGFSTLNAAIAVGVSSVAVFARVMRSEVLKVRELTFVESSYLIGAHRWRVLARHILPNAYSGVLTLAVLEFGAAVVAISILAFLGYGNPPPWPEWGLMVSEGRDFLRSGWWLVAGPGSVIVLTVLSFNRLSQFVRERR